MYQVVGMWRSMDRLSWGGGGVVWLVWAGLPSPFWAAGDSPHLPPPNK